MSSSSLQLSLLFGYNSKINLVGIHVLYEVSKIKLNNELQLDIDNES